MKPLVSIIIPIYNVENYLERCIDSVVYQTYSNIEIILVNDGSPDKSPLIADHYARLDSRIHVINKNNGGLSDARNAGLSFSRGEFICFVDSDDYVEPDMVEKTLCDILSSGLDVLIYGLFNELHDKSGNVISEESVNIVPEDPTSVISIIGYAWNKLYRANLLKKNKIQFEKGLVLVEDIVFNEKVFGITEKIGYLNIPFYHYISRERSTLVKKYHRNSYDIYKIGYYSRRSAMNVLFDENYELSSLMAKSHLDGIRYCCSNMFYYINNLTAREKYNNIKEMLKDIDTINQMKYMKTEIISDKIMLFIVKNKLSLSLFILYYFKSIVKKRRL